MADFLASDAAALVAPAITSNSRSHFAVVWGVTNGARLVGALFDLQGNPASGEFAVSTASGTVCRLPAAAHMAGEAAGFAVAWIEGSPGRVVVRRFDREGTPRGEPLALGTGVPMPGFGPALASAPDTSVLVCWIEESGAAHALAFDPSGAPRGPALRLGPPGSHTGPVRVAGLQNNSFVVAWPDGLGNLLFQVLDSHGQPARDAGVLDVSHFGGAFALAPIVNTAPDAEPGHFALAHVTTALPGGQRLVVGAAFRPSGQRLSSFNITQRDRNTIADHPAITALPGRRFLVAWSEVALPELGDATGENVHAVLCSAERGPLPGAADAELGGLIPVLEVSATPAGRQGLPAAAFVLDFETGEAASAVVWLDDTLHGAEAPVRAVRGRVFGAGELPA